MPGQSASADQLSASSREIVFAMWAAELGMSLAELTIPNCGVWISPNRDFEEIIVVRLGEDTRIAAPAPRIEALSDLLGSLRHPNYCDPGFWLQHFPSWVASMTTPSTIYYLDATRDACDGKCDTPPGMTVRGLTASDTGMCADFAQQLTAAERDSSGLDIPARHAWGVFCDGRLAAVSNYEAWPGRIAHVGVATAPEYRKRGLAALAVRAALQEIFRLRRIAQFRAASDDVKGNALAKTLGFLPVLETLSIRTKPARPGFTSRDS